MERRTTAIPSEYGEIVLIEYDHNREPMWVFTRDHDRLKAWRLTPSEKDGVTYLDDEDGHVEREGHVINAWSDTSRRTPIWYLDEVVLRKWVRNHYDAGGYNVGSEYAVITDPAELHALGHERIDAPLSLAPFAGTQDLEGDSLEYCQFCGPMRSDSGRPCPHLFDAGIGGMEGPGEDSYREPYEVPEGFKRLVRRLGCARHLLADLVAGQMPRLCSHGSMLGPASVSASFGGRRYDDAFERISQNPGTHEDEYQQGFLWMNAMDEETVDFNAAVVAWLREEIAAQNERRKGGETVYRVRSGGAWGTTLHAKDCTFARAADLARRLRAKGKHGVRLVRRVSKAKE